MTMTRLGTQLEILLLAWTTMSQRLLLMALALLVLALLVLALLVLAAAVLHPQAQPALNLAVVGSKQE